MTSPEGIRRKRQEEEIKAEERAPEGKAERRNEGKDLKSSFGIGGSRAGEEALRGEGGLEEKVRYADTLDASRRA